MKEETMRAKGQFIFAMMIFGTLGIFIRYIPLPSTVIAEARGILATLFLLVVVCLRHSSISKEAVKKNFKILFLSGAAIGVNWILLFEAYRYTTVSTATLSYYMAPVFVILASPFVVKEKLTAVKFLCALSASALYSGNRGLFIHDLCTAHGGSPSYGRHRPYRHYLHPLFRKHAPSPCPDCCPFQLYRSHRGHHSLCLLVGRASGF